jgi:hypothetical protein
VICPFRRLQPVLPSRATPCAGQHCSCSTHLHVCCTGTRCWLVQQGRPVYVAQALYAAQVGGWGPGGYGVQDELDAWLTRAAMTEGALCGARAWRLEGLETGRRGRDQLAGALGARGGQSVGCRVQQRVTQLPVWIAHRCCGGGSDTWTGLRMHAAAAGMTVSPGQGVGCNLGEPVLPHLVPGKPRCSCVDWAICRCLPTGDAVATAARLFTGAAFPCAACALHELRLHELRRHCTRQRTFEQLRLNRHQLAVPVATLRRGQVWGLLAQAVCSGRATSRRRLHRLQGRVICNTPAGLVALHIHTW